MLAVDDERILLHGQSRHPDAGKIGFGGRGLGGAVVTPNTFGGPYPNYLGLKSKAGGWLGFSEMCGLPSLPIPPLHPGVKLREPDVYRIVGIAGPITDALIAPSP